MSIFLSKFVWFNTHITIDINHLKKYEDMKGFLNEYKNLQYLQLNI